MIFVDSNVPMYLVGAPHPNRDLLESFLRANAEDQYITSAEVYQEVIHRYAAIDRREAIADCFTLLDALVVRTLPVTREDAETAKTIATSQLSLSARDCLHLAVMKRHGLQRILTLDRGFEMRPEITRLPAH